MPSAAGADLHFPPVRVTTGSRQERRHSNCGFLLSVWGRFLPPMLLGHQEMKDGDLIGANGFTRWVETAGFTRRSPTVLKMWPF